MTKGSDKPGPTPRSLLIIKLFLFEDSGRRDRNGVWEGSVAIGGPEIRVMVMVIVIALALGIHMAITGHRLTCSKF